MKRATKGEIEARITKIVSLILEGMTELKDIVELSKREGWDLTERQLWSYKNKADKDITEHYRVQRNTMYGKQMARYERLLNECIKAENYREWRATLSAIDRITGLTK